MALQNIVLNFAESVRHETLHDKSYIVVPVAMLTEGVHDGSNGPLYYPKEELEKTPNVWNTKPVVVYHPSMNGLGISACDPDVLEKQQVGFLMNTQYDGKLRSEAWLEVSRLQSVDKRVLSALESGELMEVSTGLYTDDEYNPGEWNGKEYEYVARNHRPDHLAILPDKIGACSIADGAGLLQTNESATTRNNKKPIATNALSYDDKRSLLYRALEKRFGSNVYIADIFDKFIVYEHGRMMFKISYSINKSVVVLADVPEEVTRSVQYRKLDGAVVVNTTSLGKRKMNKEEFVDKLINNSETAWSSEDRSFLLEQDEDQLKKFAPVENDDSGDDPNASVTSDDNASAVNNAAKKGAEDVQPTNQAITLDQLPLEVQAVYNHGLNALNSERNSLIEAITANENSPSKEYLVSKSIDDLRILASLVKKPDTQQPQHLGNPIPVYSGQATPPPVSNTTQEEEPLEIPVMNFGSD